MIKLSVNQGNFALEITSVEKDPSGQKWFDFKSSAISEGFSGWSSFCSNEGTISAFLDDLKRFDESMTGNPKLVCGVGDIILFELEFLIADKLGHIGVKISFAIRHVTHWGCGNRVSLEFDTDIQSVSDFRKNLESLINSG